MSNAFSAHDGCLPPFMCPAGSHVCALKSRRGWISQGIRIRGMRVQWMAPQRDGRIAATFARLETQP